MNTARCLESNKGRKVETINELIATELSELVACFDNPVCVYATDVAKVVESRGGSVAAFDTRIEHELRDYRNWDLRRPVYVANEFDLIVCGAHDPDVGLDQLFHAMRVLSHFDYSRPLLLIQPEDNVEPVIERLQEFGLKKCATRTVHGRNVAYLANFDLPIF